MKLEYRYVFRNDYRNSKRIINFLKQNNINYDDDELTSLVVVEFFDDAPYFQDLQRLFQKYKIAATEVTKVFTETELNSADWLTIRSTYRLGFPQPENNFHNITYSSEKMCNKCQLGLYQKDLFYINKLPRWTKNRHFFQPFWIEDELFISDYATDIFKENNVDGVEFLPVKKYRKNEVINGVYQIKITESLDKCFAPDNSDIRKINTCSQCGRISYLKKGETILKFKNESFNDNFDFIKTYEYFGEVVTGKIIVVSNKIYRLIKENKIDRGLVFEPIHLIDNKTQGFY